MNLSTIKPSTHGQSDKYSWNLYAYLKKNKGEHRILWDRSDGKPLYPQHIYVMQGTIGRTLLSILWQGNKGDKHCYSMYPVECYLDITEQFWEDYEAKGRCVFHDHDEVWLQGEEQRFTMLDKDTKFCQWCGATLRRTEKTVTKTVERWEVQ